MSEAILTRMRQLVGSPATWAANDLVLALGEIGIEVQPDQTSRMKIGDGVHKYSALQYLGVGLNVIRSPVTETLNALPGPSARAGMLLGFAPVTGQPVMSGPTSGSATDLALALAGPSGAAQVGIADATDRYTGTNVEQALAQVGTDIRGRLRDVRTFTGIVADGVTDDFVAFQAAVIAARDAGHGIYFAKNVRCFLQFTNTQKQIFVDGGVRWEGAERTSSGLLIHCNYDMGNVHAPLFCWGIPSKGAAVNKVSGTVRGVGFSLKAGSLKFERMCHIYAAQDFVVDGCYCDMRGVTWPAADAGHPNGYQAGGWWSSNQQPTWATGQTRDRNIRIVNCIGYASAEYQNAECIGISYCDTLEIANNYLSGWSDDIAAHMCTDVHMHGNHYESVAGRFMADNCQHVRILSNRISPLTRPLVGGYLGPTRAYIMVNMSAQYAAILDDPPSTNVTIAQNQVLLPVGSYCQAAITTYGVQDGQVITDNEINNLGATSGTLTISVNSMFRAGWTGPGGNPDFAAGGSVRVRGVRIDGNVCTGPGWIDGEGTIVVQPYAGGTVADILGPVDVHGNVAPSYNMASEAITFGKNFGLFNSTDPFKGVSLVALWNALPTSSSWRGLLPASANINNTNFPQATPVFYTALDSDGLKFIAQRAGRVIGAHMQLTAGMTAGNNAVLRVLKNNAQIGTDLDSSTNTPSTNPARYTWNYPGVAGMTFAEGDKLDVQLTIRAAQGATSIVGRIELVVLYH